MEKIAIVTDSNSGITQEEGRRLGVSVLPMPFYINDVMYLEGDYASHRKSFMRNSRMMRRFLLHSQAQQRCACGLVGQSFEGV